MKKILTLAAALALAACATVDRPVSSNVAQARSASGTYYCWKDKLDARGDSLLCNWENTVNDACRSYNSTPLNKSAIASGPSDARRCENGQWLVMVTTR